MAKTLKIGGASGFWGESSHAAGQLLAVPGLDYLVFDYLAEITMSIMARARMKDPDKGYAEDFVTKVMAANLADIADKGVKVIANAGGVNPMACARALEALIATKGLSLRVGVVTGDDLTARAVEFSDRAEMFSAQPFPPADEIASINAYLGAFPIAAALDGGADIVITGRCVDSAVTLGACIHRFGWTADAFDLLASGSLAGHLLECGPQSTGGNFTDWEEAGDIADIGYPVAEISADGGIVLTKPAGTSGIVSPLSVGEQMLYEIGDPRAYVLPDVICDFSAVSLTQQGPDRVTVAGAKGRAPSGKLKVSATYQDGWRTGQVFQFNGRDAEAKARAFASAGLTRARRSLAAAGLEDFAEVSVETFGAPEETSIKVAVRHGDPKAIGIWIRDTTGVALATPPGLHFFGGGGRPRPSPIVALFSFLLDSDRVPLRVSVSGDPVPFTPPGVPIGGSDPVDDPTPLTPGQKGEVMTVPLEAVAVARSGDKGDSANIGVMARHPDFLPSIWQALDEQTVASVFADLLEGEVRRYWLPGSAAMNIVMTQVLGGGGIASLRSDPQGKGFAQMLLGVPVTIPADLARRAKSLGRVAADQDGMTL